MSGPTFGLLILKFCHCHQILHQNSNRFQIESRRPEWERLLYVICRAQQNIVAFLFMKKITGKCQTAYTIWIRISRLTRSSDNICENRPWMARRSHSIGIRTGGGFGFHVGLYPIIGSAGNVCVDALEHQRRSERNDQFSRSWIINAIELGIRLSESEYNWSLCWISVS